MRLMGGRDGNLVCAQSGFSVTLDSSEPQDFWQQLWRFDAHYVPALSAPSRRLRKRTTN